MEKLFLIAYVVVVHHPEEDTLDLNLNWTEIGAKLKKEMKWFQKDNSYYLPTLCTSMITKMNTMFFTNTLERI